MFTDSMIRWHREFERLAPQKHLAFLRFLCIPEEEIRAIREFGTSREQASGADKPRKRETSAPGRPSGR